jgi:hypothetical protein
MPAKGTNIGISSIFSYYYRQVHMGGFPTFWILELTVKITGFHSKFVEISYGIPGGWDLFHNGTVTSFHWEIKLDLE